MWCLVEEGFNPPLLASQQTAICNPELSCLRFL